MSINQQYRKNQSLSKSGEAFSQNTSSYILENIHEQYVFSGNNNNQAEEDYSPMNPTNLHSRLSKFLIF